MTLPRGASVRYAYDEWQLTLADPSRRGAGVDVPEQRVLGALMEVPPEYIDVVALTVLDAFGRFSNYAKTRTAALGNQPLIQVSARAVGVVNFVAKGIAPVLSDGPGVRVRDRRRIEGYRERLRAARAHRVSIGVYHHLCDAKLDELVVGADDDIRSVFEEEAVRALSKGSTRAKPVSREIYGDDPLWHMIEWQCPKCLVPVRASLRDIAEGFLECHEAEEEVFPAAGVKLKRLRKKRPPLSHPNTRIGGGGRGAPSPSSRPGSRPPPAATTRQAGNPDQPGTGRKR